jgi:CDP-glucose 4,6-dehydratase
MSRTCGARRRALVTGASGFVGAHLVKRLLDEGTEVVTLLADWHPDSMLVATKLIDHIRVHVGGVEDFDLLNKVVRAEGIDTVFHLAATAVEGAAFAHPLRAFEVNIRGTYNLLEACRANLDQVARVVVASSDKAYGDVPQLPYTEDMPMAGKHPYDVSKSCADLISRCYHISFGLPVAVGRFGNIFGPGDLNYSRLVPGTIRRLLGGERPVVRVAAAGEFSRDFLYVADAVDAYLAMCDGLDSGVAAGEAFNFSLGCSLSPLWVVQEIQRLMDRQDLEPEFELQGRGEVVQQQIANDKAVHLLGWIPKRVLVDGLLETIAWYYERLAVPISSGATYSPSA